MKAEPLVFAIMSVVVTITGTLTIQWVIARFARHDRQASLEVTNTELLKRQLSAKTAHDHENWQANETTNPIAISRRYVQLRTAEHPL